MKNIYLILFLACSIISCNNTPNPNEKLVIGNWQAISWVNTAGQPVEQTQTVQFNFTADGKYSYTNEGVKETGTYKIENDMLFTTAEKQNEMMVKIAKATTDSLVFEMSRGGQNEVLSLVKK